MGTQSLRIIVTGLVALHPLGGVAWDYLQYVIGLRRLGHEVYYYEDTWSWPYDPLHRTHTNDPSYSVRFIADFLERYDPGQTDPSWRYRHLHEDGFGVPDWRWRDILRSADLFLNVSGASIVPDELSPGCLKVFVDTDPGYNQIVLLERPDWSENVDRWCDSVVSHDRHFTYAENIYGKDSHVPDASLSWKTTRMPIVMDLWRDFGAPPAWAPWSTIMTWNGFAGPLVFAGQEYGSKDREFERIIDLPRRISSPLVVALGGRGAPVDRLSAAGWAVVDGPESTLTPEVYRGFLAASRGEVSIAKHVYVAMRTGWFSCRSACYLAMGRPVVVQDTGFSSVLPTREGIVAFRTLEEAVEGIALVEQDLERHSSAARAIAAGYFDSTIVLTRLLYEAFAHA